MLGIEPAQEPLDRKIFNMHLDNLLSTGQLNPDIIPWLDRKQAYCINEVKKSLVRLSK